MNETINRRKQRSLYRSEIENLRGLLKEASIHVYASASAEHMLDGFTPKPRPIDDLVGRIKSVLEDKNE